MNIKLFHSFREELRGKVKKEYPKLSPSLKIVNKFIGIKQGILARDLREAYLEAEREYREFTKIVKNEFPGYLIGGDYEVDLRN